MNHHLSLLHLPRLSPVLHHHPRHHRLHGRTTVFQARLPSPQRTNQHRLLAVTTAPPEPEKTEEQQLLHPLQEPAEGEVSGGGGADRTCGLPTWALIGAIAAAVALSSAAAAGPAAALGPEGPLVEEFWDNMRRYALYVVTVSTGFAYTLAQPIVELLKNPVTALLIVAVLAGGGFLVSQVLNAMVGNSDFIYTYDQ
ncbi:hypothetical protein OsI_26809 [Oryza sativa Indica Group]|uniref:Uncharacterized protein ycf33 n=2 Tax=Oryza TaxID=4527 RepID=A0A0E0I3I1_ORYNI|nr:hypothetical protein OsI_26809 [Oryza sativa Indica Group]